MVVAQIEMKTWNASNVWKRCCSTLGVSRPRDYNLVIQIMINDDDDDNNIDNDDQNDEKNLGGETGLGKVDAKEGWERTRVDIDLGIANCLFEV